MHWIFHKLNSIIFNFSMRSSVWNLASWSSLWSPSTSPFGSWFWRKSKTSTNWRDPTSISACFSKYFIGTVKSPEEASACLPFTGQLPSGNAEETKVTLVWSELKSTTHTPRKVFYYEEKTALILWKTLSEPQMILEKWSSSVENPWWWLVRRRKQLCKLILWEIFFDREIKLAWMTISLRCLKTASSKNGEKKEFRLFMHVSTWQ